MSRPLHIFDLDKTFLTENISYRFGQFLYKNNIISLAQTMQAIAYYVLFLLGIISITSMHHKIFYALFKNTPSTKITSLVDGFLAQNLYSYTNPVALNMFKEAQEKQCLTALFSSSPDFLVQPIAHSFRFDEYLATKYSVDKQGTFCDISLIVEGNVKAAEHAKLCVKHKLNPKDNIVYSDSENDLPLMLSAGNCYVFQPNKKLLKYCIDNDWTAIF